MRVKIYAKTTSSQKGTEKINGTREPRLERGFLPRRILVPYLEMAINSIRFWEGRKSYERERERERAYLLVASSSVLFVTLLGTVLLQRALFKVLFREAAFATARDHLQFFFFSTLVPVDMLKNSFDSSS